MVQPLLNHNRAGGKPGCVDAWPRNVNPMTVRMTVSQNTRVRQCFSRVRVKLSQQDLSSIETHEHSTTEQKAAHTKSANALYFSVSIRESFAWWLDGPSDGAECHEIRDEVGERVVGVGDQSL